MRASLLGESLDVAAILTMGPEQDAGRSIKRLESEVPDGDSKDFQGSGGLAVGDASCAQHDLGDCGGRAGERGKREVVDGRRIVGVCDVDHPDIRASA